MTGERERLFPELAPPPGGEARFRARLDEDTAKVRRRRWLLAPALLAAAAALTLVALRLGPAAPAPVWPGDSPALVRLGLAPMPVAPVSVPMDARATVAVREVPVDAPDVVFYRVEVLAPAP